MVERRRAFITGIAGQDGIYLTKLLRDKGYLVFGVAAPGASLAEDEAQIQFFDVRECDRLASFLREVQPDECFHLAAFHRSSSARVHTEEARDEFVSIETNVLSVQVILSTLFASRPACRVFLAGSCQMFGDPSETPQTEQTPFNPRTIYGITKVAATQLGHIYREKGMHVSTGILYNHESPFRSPEFVTSKIARMAVEISQGTADRLALGDVSARVDWGFAGDYVEAMHLMVTADQPRDYIISSGELHSVGEFAKLAFECVGLDWKRYVVEDPGAYQPVAKGIYFGGSSAIRERLDWRPKKQFREIVEMMVERYLQQV
jgi:GDPmannose 4,6-dehydratase